jgi:sugar/nucleoside kinase (ribokinase family)
MDIFIRDRRHKVEEMVRFVRLLILNASELEMLARTRGAAAGAENILMRFRSVAAVIVKRGADGAVLVTRGGSQRLRACAASVVDPTGAGDALAGAVMGRLVQRGRRLDQDSLMDALEWGLVAAAFTIEKAGTAGIRDCTLDDLQARLEAYRLEVRPGEPRQS